MRVRPAFVDDAEAIAAVHVRSWQVGYRRLLPDSVLDSLEPAQRIPRWRTALEATSWPDRGTLVADDDAAGVVGFANLSPTRNTDQDPDSTGEITSFYVAPDVWGRGVGQRLMEASLEALAIRYRTGALWVLDTNSRAIRFYEATGWRPDGVAKDDVLAGIPIRDLRRIHDLCGTTGHLGRDPLS